MPVSLRPHQEEALANLATGKILCGDTGSGKSITALAYFVTEVCGGFLNSVEPFETPTDLYIITTARKRDSLEWEGDLTRLALSTNPEVSIHGTKVVVDSWNNIKKYEDVKNAFFIFDEQRLSGSGVWVKTFLKIAESNDWLLLSATPADVWSDYIPVFIANGFYRNRSEFMDSHAVWSRFSKYPKVDRYLGIPRLERLEKQVLVDMPFERSTKQHIRPVVVEYDQDLYKRVTRDRWNPYLEVPIDNASQLVYLQRKVTYSHESRFNAVLKILEDHPRVIVFYNFTFEVEALRRLADHGHLVREWNGEKHEELPTGDAWVYLVQYAAGAEAWNCTTTDTMVFYSTNYSYRVFKQARGRIDRLNTPYTKLYYYVLNSTARIDLSVWRALSNKKDFNERKYRSAFEPRELHGS